MYRYIVTNQFTLGIWIRYRNNFYLRFSFNMRLVTILDTNKKYLLIYITINLLIIFVLLIIVCF